MASDDTTVYVNDNPIGETDVYHARQAHVSTLDKWRDRYVRETTVDEAREEGLRPCKQCYPDDSGLSCPGCGYPGDPEDVVDDQRWCENGDCRVLSFRGVDDAE